MSMDLPTHVYIPGQTERHPEDAFDALRETAVGGCSAEQLAQCDAFKAGLVFLDKGFYWEAHEVLEPVWMVLPVESVERKFVQGIIQLANGRLKLSMKRPKAAQRLVAKARELMPVDGQTTIMTLKTQDVKSWIDALENDVNLAL